MTSWNVTMLLVHLGALAGATILYRAAPCWMQKVVMALLALSSLIFVSVYALQIAGVWMHWLVVRAALEVEHIAVLLYVFRLIYRDHLQWTSSAHFPNSLR